MYDTILVATDGSDGANRAERHALALGEHFGATVHAIYVVDTRRYGETALSSAELVLEELEAEGTDILEAFAERADNRGVRVETRCCHGTPDEEIRVYADDVDADVVVLGYQGHSHRVKIGSTADRVVNAFDRPVLVV
jgi:nucleotide-binding universal stress UspA family protein